MPWTLGRPYEAHWSALLFPLNLITWSIGLCLVVWLSVIASESCTWIVRFLCHRMFVPLSRTTYSVYLTHVWVVWPTIGARYELIDLRTRSVTFMFIGVIIISFAIGFIFTILFDSPVICAIGCIKSKLIYKQSNLNSAHSSNVQNNNNDEHREMINAATNNNIVVISS